MYTHSTLFFSVLHTFNNNFLMTLKYCGIVTSNYCAKLVKIYELFAAHNFKMVHNDAPFSRCFSANVAFWTIWTIISILYNLHHICITVHHLRSVVQNKPIEVFLMKHLVECVVCLGNTVPIKSIRHPVWPVTGLTKLWFHQVGYPAVTNQKFRQCVLALDCPGVGPGPCGPRSGPKGPGPGPETVDLDLNNQVQVWTQTDSSRDSPTKML